MITFDASTHTYCIDGTPARWSVTGVLKDVGIIDFSHVPKAILDNASNFGKAVHLATALHDADNLDHDTLDKPLEPFLDAWIKFKKESEILITAIEQPIGSKALSLCGTPDREGLYRGQNFVIEIKAVAMFAKATPVQTAGYKYLANLHRVGKEKIKDRLAVNLHSNGTYELLPKKAFRADDENTFLSAFNVAKWKGANL